MGFQEQEFQTTQELPELFEGQTPDIETVWEEDDAHDRAMRFLEQADCLKILEHVVSELGFREYEEQDTRVLDLKERINGWYDKGWNEAATT